MKITSIQVQLKNSGRYSVFVDGKYAFSLSADALLDSRLVSGQEVSESDIVVREDGSFLLDGLLPIDELKDLLDIDELPEEEKVGFQTVGGFVMNQIGSIPNVGQHFHFLNFEHLR